MHKIVTAGHFRQRAYVQRQDFTPPLKIYRSSARNAHDIFHVCTIPYHTTITTNSLCSTHQLSHLTGGYPPFVNTGWWRAPGQLKAGCIPHSGFKEILQTQQVIRGLVKRHPVEAYMADQCTCITYNTFSIHLPFFTLLFNKPGVAWVVSSESIEMLPFLNGQSKELKNDFILVSIQNCLQYSYKGGVHSQTI